MKSISIETENSSEVAELREAIISKRDAGEVLLEIKRISPNISLESDEDLTALADALVTQLGCSSIGDRWRQISKKEARDILELILTKDLAYAAELIKSTDADKIITKFKSLFGDNCKFFTNASFNENHSRLVTWNSITDSTFDTGVVVVTPEKIGLLWVQDED